ncbi:MAG: hypothetical protein WA421_09700, partial [Nitrososphaeraceae archaeon]
PLALQYLSYLLPTTHASLILQYTMGFPVPKDWSIALGLGVQIVYLVGFVALAKTKAIWRER